MNSRFASNTSAASQTRTDWGDIRVENTINQRPSCGFQIRRFELDALDMRKLSLFIFARRLKLLVGPCSLRANSLEISHSRRP